LEPNQICNAITKALEQAKFIPYGPILFIAQDHEIKVQTAKTAGAYSIVIAKITLYQVDNGLSPAEYNTIFRSIMELSKRGIL